MLNLCRKYFASFKIQIQANFLATIFIIFDNFYVFFRELLSRIEGTSIRQLRACVAPISSTSTTAQKAANIGPTNLGDGKGGCNPQNGDQQILANTEMLVRQIMQLVNR
jgi:hypothetical protein